MYLSTKAFSARARESALRVRRHQDALGSSQQPGTGVPSGGGLSPAIAARVKEILAGKQKKGKAKAKGKVAAKPKLSDADKQAAKDKKKAEAATAKAAERGKNLTKVGEDTDLGDHLANLDKFKQGKGIKEKDAAELEKRGLVERGSDGTPRLSGAGNAVLAAAARGDSQGAKDAASRGRDAVAKRGEQATAKADREKAKTAKVAEHAAKQKQQQHAAKQKAQARQKIAAEKAKAKAAKDAAKLTPAAPQASAPTPAQPKATKAMTEIETNGPRGFDELRDVALGALSAIKAGARHSKLDASHLDEAARHLHAAGATCPDCAPGDAPDASAEKAIKGIMDNPAWYASHECGDVSQACSALQTLAMLIQSELSEEDEDDASIGQLVDAADTLIEFIQGELQELRGAASDAAELPNSASVQTMKAADDDAWLHMDGGAIKAMDGDAIKGMAVLYGTKATHDLEKDYYDKNTDLWLDHWGWPKPITYHHGLDKGTHDDPVIGHWTKATVTDEGVWLEGQLDRAHRYYKAIKQLAQRGYLKISSDSGPQWTIREPQSNGANYIKRWPLVSASVTVTPMEPRMFPVEVKAFLAELGYEAIESDNQEAIKANGDRGDGLEAGSERARVLSLELDLLELETA